MELLTPVAMRRSIVVQSSSSSKKGAKKEKKKQHDRTTIDQRAVVRAVVVQTVRLCSRFLVRLHGNLIDRPE